MVLATDEVDPENLIGERTVPRLASPNACYGDLSYRAQVHDFGFSQHAALIQHTDQSKNNCRQSAKPCGPVQRKYSL